MNKKGKLMGLVEKGIKFGETHQREIMLGGAIAGTVITSVLSWRAGIKADKVLKAQEKKMQEIDILEEDPDVSEDKIREMRKDVTIETVKKVTPIVLPPALAATGTIISVVAGYKVASKQIAVLSSLYTMAEKGLSEYQGKAKEIVGEKKAQQIEDEAKAAPVKSAAVDDIAVIRTGHGSQLWYDDYTGRYFYSDPEYIRKVVNDINEQLRDDVYVSLNDFYERLGLPSCKLGDDIGFCIDDGNLDVKFSYTGATIGDKDNIPCGVISYKISPKYGFGDFSGRFYQ